MKKKPSIKGKKAVGEYVRTEAAQRRAIKLYQEGEFRIVPQHLPNTVELHALPRGSTETVAIFDIRDCYRKRKPLKGITKKLRKALR